MNNENNRKVITNTKRSNTKLQDKMNKKNTPKIFGVYIRSVLTTKIVLHVTEIGNNLIQNLEKKLIQKTSNKCIPEGYIKHQSIKIQNYSAGLVPMSSNIQYTVVYECMLCHPVEGMLMKAKVKHITKAGLRCDIVDEEGNIPIIVFIIREHSNINEYFNSIKEDDEINLRVIGVMFELNDPYISVIGELVESMSTKRQYGGDVDIDGDVDDEIEYDDNDD